MGNQNPMNTTEVNSLTPAEIAKKLTPAQVRALRDPAKCSRMDFVALLPLLSQLNLEGYRLLSYRGYTPLGRAVLAELDGGKP